MSRMQPRVAQAPCVRSAAIAAKRAPPVSAAPLGSTVSLDELELPPGFVMPKMSSKDGKVLHPDLVRAPQECKANH